MTHVFENFARYRDIIWYRTLAGLKSEARQNFLGYIWFLLEPAITTLILYVVYVLIFNNGGKDKVVLLLLGTITWQWFESSVNLGMSGVKAKLHILVHFTLPKYVFPLVNVLTNTCKFLCVFVVLLGFCALCGYLPNWQYLWLPLVLAVELLLIIGLALPLSIGFVYFNDLATVVSSLFRLLMFVSGTFFSATMVANEAPAALPYFYANPMACIIDSYRNIIMAGQPPDFGLLAYAAIWGLTLGGLGLLWCHRVEGQILKRVHV